jgi:hypothetical protein
MWIPITLAAATFQILRTSRQHRLRSVLSVNGAGFVRYAYGFPLAVLASIVTFAVVGDELPAVPVAVLADHRRGRCGTDPRHARTAAGVRSPRLRHRHRLREDRGDPGRDRVGDRARRTARTARMGGGARVHGRRRVAGGAEPVARHPRTRRRPGGADGSRGGWMLRAGRCRYPRRIDVARGRDDLGPRAADPDRDARHPDRAERVVAAGPGPPGTDPGRGCVAGRTARRDPQPVAGPPGGRWRSP